MATPARKIDNRCKLASPPALKVIPAPPPPPKTVYKLDSMFLAMRKRFPVTMEGHTGIINGIQAEDGSGKSWLVKFHNKDKWVWVRAV